MAVTKLEDVIVPEVFASYIIERTAELSAFWQSGIVSEVAELDLPSGGGTVNMPFWQDLTGEDQVLDTSTDLTVAKIEASKDVAVMNARALVYGATDLATALAGDDPMGAAGDLIAGKWARRMQAALVSTLNGSMGALAAEGTPINSLDISALTGAAAVVDGESMIDAGGMLGDAESGLTAVAMHSATERLFRKQGLIDYLPDDEGKPTIAVYMGRRVIVDDGMPVTAGVYTTYLFGPGAVGYGEGSVKVPVETQRAALTNGGEEYLVNRRHFVLHPRGVRWSPDTGVPAKDTPSNAELANADNWARVYEPKNIRIVAFKHRLVAV
ncbi:major capsid protein [Cereibacter sphaeroides]|nr:major capsid protein [Cereibacter sphaeroides]